MSTLNLTNFPESKMGEPQGKPLYRHDCSRCQFLGSVDDSDLYVCAGTNEQTVIARYSDEGSNYASGLYFAYGANPLLTEARLRAQKLGILPYDLEMALAYVGTIAEDNPCANELLTHLRGLPLFEVISEMATDLEKGTKALHALFQNQVEAELQNDKTLTKDDAVDIVWPRMNRVWTWMRHFKQPVPSRNDFMRAVFSYPQEKTAD